MTVLDAVMMTHPKSVIERARLSVLRFLAFHNQLEGLMALTAVWWGAWTLVFPDFWSVYPATASIAMRLWGHPEILSWTLLLTGSAGYLGKVRRWMMVRSFCTLAAFVTWSLLAVSFFVLKPIFALGVATYSLFAFQAMLTYMYLQTGVEQVVVDADALQAKQRAGTEGGS